VSELVQAGLLDGPAEDPRLTPKGRSWLRTLEDLQTQEVVTTTAESNEDFVQSTSGIFR
jgi:hypothetical protein